ncbi:MAG: penicillin-binding protein 1C [Myxococcales bacterium]|nr:penicillin-binding protein 1C [Myxococcales bacterium]
MSASPLFARIRALPVRPRQRWRLALALTLLSAVSVWAFFETAVNLGDYPIEERIKTEQTSLQFFDRHGTLLRELPGEKSRFSSWVSLDEIAPHLVEATIISEDKRFFSHDGIDRIAVLRAAFANLRARRVVSGASTLTMQLVRLLRPRPRTLASKWIEAIEARRLERRFGKWTILEQYLNRAPYGNGAIGVEAASRLYFGKPARQLSLAEAAFLAVIPRSPRNYSPYRHKRAILGLQRQLLRRMAEAGRIDALQYGAALAETIDVERWGSPFLAPHFIRHLRRSGLAKRHVHASRRAPRESVQRIVTTLDVELQRTVERIIRDSLPPLEPHGVSNASVVVLDNKTGDVLAWVGSRRFFDKKHHGQVDGVTALRQPGSTLKPFAYGLALSKGYTAASLVADIETLYRLADGRTFRPRNYDGRYYGPKRLRSALASSLNISALKVTSWVGDDKLLATLRRVGLTSLKKKAEFYGLGLVLGNGETTLLQLATAYMSLARRGEYIAPRLVLERRTVSGKRYRMPTGRRRRVFGERVAYLVSEILSDPMARLQGFGVRTPFNFPFQVAVKTGTSNNWRDNWTIGYTPALTVAVWVGNFDGRPMHNVSGVTGAGPIFRRVMRAAMKDRPQQRFETEKKMVTTVICPLSGKLPGKHCPHRMEEHFIPGTEPRETCNFHREVVVDRRTGLLAGPTCPENVRETRVSVVYPPEYASWVRSHHVFVGPTRYSPLCRATKRSRDEPQILSPVSEGRYLIDPSQSGDYQRVPLKAIVPDSVESVVWYVNGKPFARVGWPYTSYWPLKPGSHRIRLVADGRSSHEVHIVVR